MKLMDSWLVFGEKLLLKILVADKKNPEPETVCGVIKLVWLPILIRTP